MNGNQNRMRVMREMGFFETWIEWIMHCIIFFTYRVLMNRQPIGNIISQRGLCQGDLLSPFIFILCTEVLISLVNHAKSKGKKSGMWVARIIPWCPTSYSVMITFYFIWWSRVNVMNL